MKKFFAMLLALCVLLSLAGCVREPAPTEPATQPTEPSTEPTEPAWAGYSGTMDGYVYRYEAGRDREWEEDVLFLAETFLKGHPYLVNDKYMITGYPEVFGFAEMEFSDRLYNDTLHTEFIAAVNTLIEQIPALADGVIPYEMKKLVASIGDIHCNLYPDNAEDAFFPVFCDHFTVDGRTEFQVYCVPQEYRQMYLSRLVAINGVPVEEIVESMRAYISEENDYHYLYVVTDPMPSMSMLTMKNALVTLGVMEENADSAEYTFEKDGQTQTCQVKTTTLTQIGSMELEQHYMASYDRLPFMYSDNYWGDWISYNTLYIRFQSMMPDETQTVQKFLQQILKAIDESEVPVRLIIDFRYNGGGITNDTAFKDFCKSINSREHDGVYLLINGASASAAVAVPYCLRQTIEGAVLVGTPTSQYVNFPMDSFTYELPNSGYMFVISSEVMCFPNAEPSDALHPDVEIYQNWEDYCNNVDTVLEYAVTNGRTQEEIYG